MKGLLRYLLITGIIAIGILVFTEVTRQMINIKITGISFSNEPVDYNNWPFMYKIPSPVLVAAEHEGKQFRIIDIQCRCTNNSFYNDYPKVNAAFTSDTNLPAYIVGRGIDSGIFPVNMPHRMAKVCYRTILVDTTHYTEKQIIDGLHGIHFYLINGEGESMKPISNVVSISQ